MLALLDSLAWSKTRYEEDYVYWIMGIGAPEVAPSLQATREAAARAKEILTRVKGLPVNSIQTYAFLTGRSEEILGLCRTIRGFQNSLIGKAREELAAIEAQLAQPMLLPKPVR